MPDKKIEPSDPSERHMSNDLLESLRLKEQMDKEAADARALKQSEEKEKRDGQAGKSMFASAEFKPSREAAPRKGGRGRRTRRRTGRRTRRRTRRITGRRC